MQKTLFKKPTRRDWLREQREDRERRFGPRLDSMDADELLRLCQNVFPDWPVVFGRGFTAQTARSDAVCRRLLLACLEDSSLITKPAAAWR